jgi:hypothetical protein
MVGKIAVLHIGTHKTATTSLQTMITLNETFFADQQLCYPTAGRVGDGHHNLAWELSGDERYDPMAGSFADLADELGKAQPRAVLLSSEDFEYLHRRPEALRSIRRTMEGLGYRTHVLVVLRQPSEYLESLYVELGKHGLEEELEPFVARSLADGGIVFRDWDFRLSYEQLVSRFAAIFGKRAVHLLRYDPVDSIGPLLEACGRLLALPLSPVVGWERFNQRPSETQPSTGDRPRDAGQHRLAEAGLSRISLTMVERERIEAAFGRSIDDLVRRYPTPGTNRLSWLSRPARARRTPHM